MILQIYTIIHTLIGLVAIFTGFIVVFGFLCGERLDGWTKWFLITVVATTVTGFFFPFHGFTPANRSRADIVACFSPYDLRVLSEEPRRSLALDLRRRSCDFALF